ncbi:MAG: PAS domain S-box protein, partial [Candidatus Rokubacteria bacterium]|nr:PAS domain S-box protein [Candidatus Rokubacteria bacterium]
GLFHRVWLPLAAAYLVGIGGGAHLMRDVAERARLHAERARFRAILDEAGEAIRIQDADTFRILDCNRKDCELSGYRRQEMIGRDAREFWPVEPELRARREAVAAEARAHGAARGFGLPYRTRGGTIISVDSTRRIVEREGRRYEIVIFRDAADREAAEAARREAAELRALTLVAGAAAHEINNPLMVISGAVELLGRRLPADGPEARLIEQTRDGVRRVKDIVLRMGRITRIEAEPDRGPLPAMLDIRKSSDPGSP